MSKKHKHRNSSKDRSRDDRAHFNMCAVETCSCVATQEHHYIPWRFLPGNSFTIQFCEDHHKVIDQMLEGIKECTPLKFFGIIFEVIYGKGAQYRNLVYDADTMNAPRTSVHYHDPTLRKGDD